MTMAEFADYYRQKKTYTEPECALWRDILYGSNKQLFWYCDPFMRAGVNMDQGGAGSQNHAPSGQRRKQCPVPKLV